MKKNSLPPAAIALFSLLLIVTVAVVVRYIIRPSKPSNNQPANEASPEVQQSVEPSVVPEEPMPEPTRQSSSSGAEDGGTLPDSDVTAVLVQLTSCYTSMGEKYAKKSPDYFLYFDPEYTFQEQGRVSKLADVRRWVMKKWDEPNVTYELNTTIGDPLLDSREAKVNFKQEKRSITEEESDTVTYKTVTIRGIDTWTWHGKWRLTNRMFISSEGPKTQDDNVSMLPPEGEDVKPVYVKKINVPTNWSRNEGEDEAGIKIVTYTSPDEAVTVTLGRQDRVGEDFVEQVEARIKALERRGYTIDATPDADTRIAGEMCRRWVYSGGGVRSINRVFRHAGDGYYLLFRLPDTKEDFEEWEPVLDNIRLSLKFTDQ